MYDRPPHMNGHGAWQMPSPMDILLRIESRLGGLENGQRIALGNDREIFGKIDDIRDRVTTLETKHQALPSPVAPPASTSRIEALTAFLVALRAVLVPGLQLAALAAVGAMAIAGAIEPGHARAWLDSFGLLN